MVTKKKAAPKRKAPPKKKAVKKYAGKTRKAPVKKKIAPKKKAVAVPKNAKKKVPARQSARVHIASSKKKGTIKPTVKKKAAKSPNETRLIRSVKERYKAFALEYAKHFNATKAALAVGYSDKNATQQGSYLLTNPKVQVYLSDYLKERAEQTKIDATWLLNRLADEATADIADLYLENGALKPVHKWPLIWRQGLVGGLDVEQKHAYIDGEEEPDGIITKIKLSDRTKRLEMIGKHVDVLAFMQQVTVTENMDLAERMRRARDRAQGKRGG